MIEPGLASRLKAQVASVGGRVDPKKLPQNPTYPHLTYELVSDPRLHSHDGPDGLVTARYQVTPWSPSYAAMKTAQDEIRAALDGFVGDMNGHHVASVMHAGGRDLYDDEVEVHFGPVDYLISYKES